MKVILQKDVKDLGKVGDMVNVSPGHARNFLFPNRLAEMATDRRLKQFEHLKRVAEVKKSKATGDRKQLIEKLQNVVLSFKVQASETERLFGSITTFNLSEAFSDLGFDIDKKDIFLEDAIKLLGQYKAVVKLGAEPELQTEVAVSVEREGGELKPSEPAEEIHQVEDEEEEEV